MYQQELDCLERVAHAKPILRRANEVIQFIGTDLFETSYHGRHEEYILPMIQEISKYFLNTNLLAEHPRIDDDRIEHPENILNECNNTHLPPIPLLLH